MKFVFVDVSWPVREGQKATFRVIYPLPGRQAWGVVHLPVLAAASHWPSCCYLSI